MIGFTLFNFGIYIIILGNYINLQTRERDMTYLRMRGTNNSRFCVKKTILHITLNIQQHTIGICNPWQGEQ